MFTIYMYLIFTKFKIQNIKKKILMQNTKYSKKIFKYEIQKCI